MKLINSAVFLMIAVLFSCDALNKDSSVVYYNDFPVQYQLHGKPISKIKNNHNPFLINVTDSILIICDTENSPHFYVYRLPDFSFQGEFGYQGDGPESINDPVFWDQVYCSDNLFELWVYQMNRLRMTRLQLNVDRLKPETKILRTVVMPPEVDDAVNIINVHDNLFIGLGGNSRGEFFTYNSETRSFKWIPFSVDNKDFEQKLRESGLLTEYNRGVIKAKPDESRFVKANTYSPIISIYNLLMEKLVVCKPTSYNLPAINSKNGLFDIENTRIYYIGLSLSDSLIYALNMNCTLSEFESNNCKNVKVDVFDWEGNPVCVYYLNESVFPTGGFAVDEENQAIYTINPKSENDYYSLFDLSELNKKK